MAIYKIVCHYYFCKFLHANSITSKLWNFRGKNGEILIKSGDNIVLCDASGRNAENITNSPNFSGGDPCWSPNGKEIAYDGNDDRASTSIYVYNLATKQSRALTSGKSPTWSPGGNMIAYNITVGQVDQLWVINADGSNPHKIADDASDPFWQPNVKK